MAIMTISSISQWIQLHQDKNHAKFCSLLERKSSLKLDTVHIDLHELIKALRGICIPLVVMVFLNS